jgi:hypothetical protein
MIITITTILPPPSSPSSSSQEVYGVKRLPSGSVFTNRELVAMFDPSRTELPYVFDDTSFKVCTESSTD